MLSPAGPATVSYSVVDSPGEPGTSFAFDTTGHSTPADAVVAKLRAADLEPTGVNAAAGEVIGRSQANSLIDCGTVIIEQGGDIRGFPGNAPSAVVPVEGSPGTELNDFINRTVSVSSEFNVSATSTSARVRESHQATLTTRDAATGEVISSETLEFGGDELGRFAEGLVCTSSGLVRRALRAPAATGADAPA